MSGQAQVQSSTPVVQLSQMGSRHQHLPQGDAGDHGQSNSLSLAGIQPPLGCDTLDLLPQVLTPLAVTASSHLIHDKGMLRHGLHRGIHGISLVTS